MSVFFGTDGLRGEVGGELNHSIAYKVGNSLSQLKTGAKVFIGCDSRVSGPYLMCALSAGLMAGGADVVFGGIMPTAAVAYLTKTEGFDYGIVITASHNDGKFNGIKIFSSKGEKLGDKQEEMVERGFIRDVHVAAMEVGTFCVDSSIKNRYFDFLLRAASCRLDGLKIVVDAGNGAAFSVAPRVFRALGATVYTIGCRPDGRHINDNCGSLHPEGLIQKVKRFGADVGLGLDGDADRLIAVSEKGEIVDGDHVLLALALSLLKKGELNQNIVVGTSMTNMGIELELAKNNIKLLRADVGDKYVAAIMFSQGLSLGGEQSGHIILSKHLHTGDGLLTAINLLCAMKQSGKTLSQFCPRVAFPQTTRNVVVKEKLRILGSETLANAVSAVQQELAGHGRVLVRASGTEPKIRVMVESDSEQKSKDLAEYLVGIISTLEDGSCAE